MKKAQFGKSLSDVWLSIKVLLTNPTWIGLTLGATVESGAVMGFATFMPKVLQFQFSLTPGAAAVLAGGTHSCVSLFIGMFAHPSCLRSGVVVVPGAAGGHFLGGLLPKLLNLRIKGLMLFLILCSVLGIVFFPIFMLTCDMPEITGVNVHYFNRSGSVSLARFSMSESYPTFQFSSKIYPFACMQGKSRVHCPFFFSPNLSGYYLESQKSLKNPEPPRIAQGLSKFRASSSHGYHSLIAFLLIYVSNSTASLEKAVLDHPCNLHCNCELDTYQPLCGTDGVQYFSPCHAACLESTETDTEKVSLNPYCSIYQFSVH